MTAPINNRIKYSLTFLFIITFIFLFLITYSMSFAAAVDDDSQIEFSTIYAGNLNDQDWYYAKKDLLAYGYTRRLDGTSHEGQVRWWSISGEYPPDYPGEYSDGADFLYYSTHGTTNNDPSTNRQYTKVYRKPDYWQSPIDLLYADGGDTTSVKYIDDGWRSKPIRSYSKWDNDLEWIILAACNQLEHFYSIEDGAHEYGKTLLGYPNRVHSIWGYHETAPEGPLYSDGFYRDTKIIRKFLKYTTQLNQAPTGGPWSVRSAWEKANELYEITSWSGVYHVANRGEAMWSPNNWPDGKYVRDDTANNTTPDIDFVYGPDGNVRDVGW